MKAEGIVKKETGKTCEVIVRRKTACGDNCASCGGACRLNFQKVTAKNPLGAKPGDSVLLEMESKKVLLSAFLVYIMPISVFAISFLSMKKIDFSDISAGGVSAVLTVISFVFTAIYDKRHKADFLPVIVKID